jgi:hypothetical protein
MCAYCWASMMQMYLDAVEALPEDRVFQIDYTNASAGDVVDLARWLGLRGVDRDHVTDALARRINSLQERDGIGSVFPVWQNWDGGMRRKFDSIAGSAMHRTGYWVDRRVRWRPREWGTLRDQGAHGSHVRDRRYEARGQVQEAVLDWIRNRRGHIRCIAETDVGNGGGVAHHLYEFEYAGFDRTAAAIEWARGNHTVSSHRFVHLDFLVQGLPEKYDLVMSHGGIDAVFDIELFLDALLDGSNDWVLCTSRQGCSPGLEEHVYRWDSGQSEFRNEISVARIHEHLELRGCQEIDVRMLETNGPDPSQVVWIAARIPKGDA